MINNKVELVMNGREASGLPWGTIQYRPVSYNDARHYLLRYDDSQPASVCRIDLMLSRASYSGREWRCVSGVEEKLTIILISSLYFAILVLAGASVG